ncbi:hypothetical protein PAXRUDRAFT_128455 [Paxillus rubicundulus Ve08.2h10]|uniref:Uncharacterized protein n=1 Tax=Paxillus rubicundulus Ve08.2h10 TaxID=930991 RepID=A0A0D0EB89_9AGAM|nr:hypothetical protein PAXRUDRAFT_128455 [Paxillus rubicundulus Ve08.2h10]
MQSQRSSHASVYSQSLGPSWAPPRAPLPPHRLAKLANALGVSTPLPATTSTGTFLSPSPTHSGSSPSASSPELPWRSVTPSTASGLNFASSSQSKYLLHIIPPVHLPHESDTSDASELALPPPTASGYHIQFRRGTLVALQSTLHAQLVVIAKEYALPSTMGMVLYLVTASPQSRQNSPMLCASPGLADANGGEPGPRLSEEIWKHIWTRVLRAEREEAIALSQSSIPNSLGLGLTMEPNCQSQFLRPLVTPMRTETPQPRPLVYPLTPSTSTTSSASDLPSQEKSAGTLSSHSEPEPDTPDTSRSSDHGPQIELPGLNCPSIIPILAKVEFDIDRRKATWYEPWVRSRRMKRSESRASTRTGSRSHAGDGSNLSDEKRAPCDLKLVERMQKPAFLRSQEDSEEGEQPTDGEYALLSESSDEIGDEDAAARMTSTTGLDPLGNIFGTEADTWADIHAESEGKRSKANNPNVIELALDVNSLVAFPEQEQDRDEEVDEIDEVRNIMRRMSQPTLNVSFPASTERSLPSNAGSGKRPVPPPLVLAPKSLSDDLAVPTEPSPMPSSGEESTNLAYLKGGSTPSTMETPCFRDKEGSSLEMEQEYQRSRSPAEEKRVGTLFEDLDLGLDLGDNDEEYDENDPNDRRRSQYLMKAKLDEIERTLAQFSPRQLKTATLDEDLTITHRRNLSSASQLPMLPKSGVGGGDSFEGRLSKSAGPSNKAWPAVPYSSMTGSANSSSPPRPANLPPSPPRLALNGVTTGAPKAFMPPPLQLTSVPTETEIRRREVEQVYPTTLRPSLSRQTNITSDSPIPLSPDPFGRYPSVYETDALPVPSYWDSATQQFSHEPSDPRPSLSSADEGSLASTTPSSRFSADSTSIAMDHGDKNTKTTAPLVSVKGFKKLWRRSKSSSGGVSQPLTPGAGRSSFQHSGPPPRVTSSDQLAAPPIPSALLARSPNGKPPVGQLQFDQESPYPWHPSRPSLSDSRPTSPATFVPNAPAHPPEKISVRKSILKSWKSVSGAASQQPVNGSEPRNRSERPISNETIKPRRPSVLDGSIPPNPKLPDQYLPSNHARTESTFFERRKSAGRSKMGPTQHYSSSSQDLLSRIPQQRTSVIMQPPGSASPSRSFLSATSRDSHAESGESFETSQFEFVSPPKVHPNLTYPYQTLDHE